MGKLTAATDPILSSNGRATTSASHQDHALNLLLTTFSTLFRTSLPLLLDFDDKFNKDLLGGDLELLDLAKKVRGSLMWFRKFSYMKVHKKSIGYSKQHTAKMIDVIKGG